jgi:hypothetical protein
VVGGGRSEGAEGDADEGGEEGGLNDLITTNGSNSFEEEQIEGSPRNVVGSESERTRRKRTVTTNHRPRNEEVLGDILGELYYTEWLDVIVDRLLNDGLARRWTELGWLRQQPRG